MRIGPHHAAGCLFYKRRTRWQRAIVAATTATLMTRLRGAGANAGLELMKQILAALRAANFGRGFPLHSLCGALLGRFANFQPAAAIGRFVVRRRRDAIARSLLPAPRDVPLTGELLIAG